MKYIQLFFLSLLPLVTVGCQAFEDEPSVTTEGKVVHIARFPLDVLGAKQIHQSSTRALVDPADLAGSASENEVDNVVLSGISNSEFNKAGKYLEIQSSDLNRSFYFAANLNAADQASVKSSATPDVLELSTLDYLEPTGQLKAGGFFPMVAAIDQVKYTDFTSSGGAVQSLLVYKQEVKFTRVFAKVMLEFTVPASATVKKVEVINVPKKFALGTAFADYDTKDNSTYGYMTFDATSVLATVGAKKSVSFYLPEHAVKNPVTNDPDIHNMTCVVVSYAVGGKDYTKTVRLAFNPTFDTSYALGKEGKVLRNFVFKRAVTLDPVKDIPGVLF